MVDINLLHATAITLAEAVGRLTTHIAGWMSIEDGDYAGDAGPAVRARFFENPRESDRLRMDELNIMLAGLEATIAEIASIHSN